VLCFGVVAAAGATILFVLFKCFRELDRFSHLIDILEELDSDFILVQVGIIVIVLCFRDVTQKVVTSFISHDEIFFFKQVDSTCT
jgi:hypothetical protein